MPEAPPASVGPDPRATQRELEALRAEVAELRQAKLRRGEAERVLRAVMEGTAATSGEAFFAATAEHLARALGMSCSIVGRLEPDAKDSVRTIAVWSDDRLASNFRYALQGTPCEDVVGDTTCCHPDDVQALFPRDAMLRAMEARSYIGTPLRRPDGEIVGLLNVVDRRPIAPHLVPIATAVLEIFASRILVELDRIEAHRALLDHRLRLEELIEERTTALRHTQDRLMQSARLASLGTLASGLAHEINNPLGIIQLATEALRRDPGDASVGLEAADRIRASVERCGHIVRSILRFARSEASDKRAHDVNDSLRATADFCREEARHRGITLRLEPDGDCLPVLANPTELQQVFVNVVQNALAAEDVGHVRIRSARGGGTVCVIVADDGRGIPEEDVPRLFDPFFTTRLHRGGTGLGLSICHGIVQDHGGQIDVHSNPDEGTEIRIELPSASEAASEAALPRGAARSDDAPGTRLPAPSAAVRSSGERGARTDQSKLP